MKLTVTATFPCPCHMLDGFRITNIIRSEKANEKKVMGMAVKMKSLRNPKWILHNLYIFLLVLSLVLHFNKQTREF